MSSSNRPRRSPFTRWTFIGYGISLAIFGALLCLSSVVPFGMFGESPRGPITAPRKLDIPWNFSSPMFVGPLLAGLSCVVVAWWFDRDNERRIEPLALVAIYLAVLGHYVAIGGANAMAYYSDAITVSAIEQSIWILAAAAVLGVLAWARIILSKCMLAGRTIATCALVCSLGTAWIVDHFLSNRTAPLPEIGIELPVVHHSTTNHAHSRNGESPFEIVLRADGKTSPEGLKGLAEAARAMPQKEELPDGRVLLQADRHVTWSTMSKVLAEVQDVGVWKLLFAAQWDTHKSPTFLRAYLPKDVGVIVDGDVPLKQHVIEIDAHGATTFDGSPISNRTMLIERLGELEWYRGNELGLKIVPHQDCSWGNVMEVLSATFPIVNTLRLGPFPLWIG